MLPYQATALLLAAKKEFGFPIELADIPSVEFHWEEENVIKKVTISYEQPILGIAYVDVILHCSTLHWFSLFVLMYIPPIRWVYAWWLERKAIRKWNKLVGQ